MRSARIVARQTTGSVSALAAVGLLAAMGCAEPVPLTPGQSEGGTSSGGASVLGGASSGATAGAGLPSGCSEHPVSLPPGGAPSVADAICSATLEPVLAPGAVRLHLAVTNNDLRLPAEGTLVFAEGLRGRLSGAPVISIDPVRPDNETRVSTPEQTDDGYAFTVYFDPKLQLFSNDQSRLQLTTTFDYVCEAGSRLVIAVTELRLCGGFPTPPTWSAPGETCVVCFENYPGTSNL